LTMLAPWRSMPRRPCPWPPKIAARFYGARLPGYTLRPVVRIHPPQKKPRWEARFWKKLSGLDE
jgi:hypothetical protein